MEKKGLSSSPSVEEVDDEYDGRWAEVLHLALTSSCTESGDDSYNEDELFVGEKDKDEKGTTAHSAISSPSSASPRRRQQPKKTAASSSISTPTSSVVSPRRATPRATSKPSITSPRGIPVNQPNEFAAVFSRVRGRGSFSHGGTDPLRYSKCSFMM